MFIELCIFFISIFVLVLEGVARTLCLLVYFLCVEVLPSLSLVDECSF